MNIYTVLPSSFLADYHFVSSFIKTHNGESQGQEEAGHTQQTSELFTRSSAVKLTSTLNKPP